MLWYILVEEILEVSGQAVGHRHRILLHLLPLTQAQQHQPQVPHVSFFARFRRHRRVLREPHVGLLKNVFFADVGEPLGQAVIGQSDVALGVHQHAGGPQLFVHHRVGVKVVESGQQLRRVVTQFVQGDRAVGEQALGQVDAGHVLHQQVHHEAVLLLGGAQRRVAYQVWVIELQEGVELIFCAVDLHTNSEE